MTQYQANSLMTFRLFLRLALFVILSIAGIASASELDRAQQQWFAGQRSQAVATLEGALSKTPDELKLRFALGVMRMEMGQVSAARSIFTALAQDFPDMAEPHNNLAVINASLGELDQARSELEQALRLQPDHVQALENLGDVLLRLGLRAYQRAKQSALAPSETLNLKLVRTQNLLQETTPKGR
jgi:Flp pilus assembly protein TadD